MKRAVWFFLLLILVNVLAAVASPHPTQIVGRCVRLSADEIVVETRLDGKVGVFRDPKTTVDGGELKVGADVTVHYRRVANLIHVR